MTPAELIGLWRRDYLKAANKPSDTSTWVGWLQGRRYYCDLRQPAKLPAPSRAGGLTDLSLEDLRALACQQGFAGDLTVSKGVAHWRRLFDYQPASGVADRAMLEQTGDVLVETGTEQPYVEQWSRSKGRSSDNYGALLTDTVSGCRGIVVRADHWLMYVRERRTALPAGRSLLELLEQQDCLENARALLDFEISFGTLKNSTDWHVSRSTLPYKAGKTWRIELPAANAANVIVSDIDSNGQSLVRVWRVTQED